VNVAVKKILRQNPSMAVYRHIKLNIIILPSMLLSIIKMRL